MLSDNEDGGRGGRGGASQRAAGAEDGGPEENLHQVDEQRLLQERGETGTLFIIVLIDRTPKLTQIRPQTPI